MNDDNEQHGIPKFGNVIPWQGKVRFGLGKDSYAEMSTDAARALATKLVGAAETVDGRTPSHVALIPLGDEVPS
jgi:hypothetical protein